jgi:hypothetical protein
MFRSFLKLTPLDILYCAQYSPQSYTFIRVNLYQPNAMSCFYTFLFFQIKVTLIPDVAWALECSFYVGSYGWWQKQF